MSAPRSPASHRPLAQALTQAQLARIEQHLVAGELRIERARDLLARQRAAGWDTRGSTANLQVMQDLQARWQRQRQDLLDRAVAGALSGTIGA